jgi:dephospho-CoA kinase
VTGGGRALRIGLTGPIGCGKSTVARRLARRQGVVVVDADLEARAVLAPGTPEVEAVYARFGRGLQGPDGALDRSALGRIVFADRAALHDLEAIVHLAVRPRILARLDEADANGAMAVVIEAIKLVEGGLAALCDEVWLVTCPRSAQVERLVARGDDPADAATRIDAQGDLADRLRPAATRVIDASGLLEATHAVADEAFEDALRREAARRAAGRRT